MKLRTRVLALIMSVFMVLASPVQALAEGESANQSGDYLSEVYVAVAKTTDEAAKALREKGYDVLKGDDGKPADLNQGAGSALKEDRAVVMGYRTTGDRGKALTDLAVMGMDGGYSFSDYRTLMAKYRDSQIRPLIERFMAAVREYRENAASENPGNRARAEAARELLNHVVEDDSGGRLGDMLLGQTLQEMGVGTEGMTEEQARAQRAAHPANLDLECALMQGNADVVLLVERLVSMAADTQETTWLERLSALGPDGLAAAYGEDRPTDAAREMAAAYRDTAKAVAAGWEQLRKALLDYDATQRRTEVGDADTKAVGTPGGEVAIEELPAEGDVSDPDIEFPAVDDADAGTLEPALDNAVQVVGSVAGTMEATAQLAEQATDAQISALYLCLSSLPYGEGTLFDLFSRPVEDVSANGYEALYPLASVLTPGQVASLEFLSITSLANTGSASGDAFAAMGPGCGGVIDALGSNDVSIYAGVNREIFSDKVALTSEALRRGTVPSEWDDLLGLRNYTVLSWVATSIAGVASLATAIRNSVNWGEYNTLFDSKQAIAKARDGIKESFDRVNELKNHLPDLNAESVTSKFRIEKLSGAMADAVNIGGKGDKLKLTFETYQNGDLFAQQTRYFDATSSGLVESLNSIDEATDRLSRVDSQLQKQASSLPGDLGENMKLAKSSAKTMYVTAGIFAVLAAVSVALTAIDVYNYYHVKMTPIPKYIVDEEDITSKAEDGTTTVVRNDSAYYQAARTDAKREGDALAAMADFADLNGDAGKGWLALYSRSGGAKSPILASSLRVVAGTSSAPGGYKDAVHAFGTEAAANLTDPRYSYNDDANGVYAYFKREAVAAPSAASVFSGGSTVLVGGLCLVAGTALGAGGMYLACRRRREPVTV